MTCTHACTLGTYGAALPNEKGVGNTCNFQPISCCISGTVKNRTKVTMTNRKELRAFDPFQNHRP